MQRSAWSCGLVPDSSTTSGDKKVLWDRIASVGRHFRGNHCVFEKINAPPGVDVTVFVHFESKTCKFCCDGVVVAIQNVRSSEFPLRLGICGHKDTKFAMIQMNFDEQALLDAKVGDRVHSNMVPFDQSGASSRAFAAALALVLLSSVTCSPQPPSPCSVVISRRSCARSSRCHRQFRLVSWRKKQRHRRAPGPATAAAEAHREQRPNTHEA